ncbi:hypothetical protein J3459_017480 [Metarhizium acridum]|nr:hypothetical protein J3459_017480 [Metarhizium acridum]
MSRRSAAVKILVVVLGARVSCYQSKLQGVCRFHAPGRPGLKENREFFGSWCREGLRQEGDLRGRERNRGSRCHKRLNVGQILDGSNTLGTNAHSTTDYFEAEQASQPTEQGDWSDTQQRPAAGEMDQ